MNLLKFVFSVLLLGTSLQPLHAQTETAEEPEANPARPSVSTPATLTPAGYLQFETGILGAQDSGAFATRYGLNEVVKLTVAPRLEMLVADEPAAHYSSFENTGNATGDLFLGAQMVISSGEGARPTIAASYIRHLYGGDAPDFDVGTPLNSVLILASADVHGFHYDTNAIFNELSETGVRRAQFGQTLSISHPVVGKLSLTGEIWHFSQPYLRGNAIGNLWAIGYNLRKNVVLDGGFSRGLTGTSTQWEEFVGFTYLLPHRLW